MSECTQTYTNRERSCADHIDVQRLRAVLEDAGISYSDYARACQISRVWIGLVFNGHRQPGELARIKMYFGLVDLGLVETYDRRAVRKMCSHA